MILLRGPMRWLIGAAIVAAALGHAFGLGDGGPKASAPAAALSTAGTAGATLVVEVGYNAGWRGPELAKSGAYSYIESGFRPNAVSPTGCLGLWQLCPTHQRDLDPQTNANDAHAKWAACAGGSFACDWTPYDGGASNPAWSAGYAAAQRAMAALPNGGR